MKEQTHMNGSNGTSAVPTALEREVDVAIVGAGFSGIAMAHRLLKAGRTDFVVLERADEVGGTWRENTYPGCQCDVPSHLYSFSFAPNPDWSSTYSHQAEIWEYLRRVVDEHGIRPYIRFGCAASGMHWDDDARRWRIETSQGLLSARVMVAGTGPLVEPRLPDIPGVESFEGTTFHSAQWNHDHALNGERVAVVGTGASAVQFIPDIQPAVGSLAVFQRTPPWVLPHTDRHITGFEHRLFRLMPGLQRAVRRAVYWSREAVVLGTVFNPKLLGLLEGAARRHLKHQVPDAELRRRLRPRYRIGCKRILMSNDYYPALQQDNVEVVTDAISEIRPHSIVTADGVEREVDTIIFGTGFHVTDPTGPNYIRGREGKSLAEVWQGSPQAHLGITVSGFPNLFLMLGPNTGLGHTSVVLMAEAQSRYVIAALKKMDEQEAATVDVRAEAQAEFVEDIKQRSVGTVWFTGCKSWYIDSTGRNSTAWPGFTFTYFRRTASFDSASYSFGPATPSRRARKAAEPRREPALDA
jgi:cation diffusion facilitator CzcD-associated flavoprotein CzcO